MRWTKDRLGKRNPIRVMSKQTKTTHSAPSDASRLTHQVTGRAPGYRTKYQYDFLGQVTNGVRHWRDGTVAAGQQFGYFFDTIGNRTQTLSGGDTNGQNLRVANYNANGLNQITSRDVPPYVDIKGVSIATNVVSVNGQTASRKWEYFRAELPVNNSTNALWTNITVSATGQASESGNLYVAQTPEQFSYDLDGNLTNDGRWIYTWDAENRLVTMTVNTNVGPQYQLAFGYDAKGRRVRKQVWNNTTGTGSPALDITYVYDGWNLLAGLTTGSGPLRTYLWGLDLSGSPQGAGGVGGLIGMTYYYAGTQTTNCFPAFDGNGNLAALVNAADGTVAANYEYGPFGELLRATGTMARANPFRFSTKYQDDESDLLYYGYRYYNASTGRWLSGDPIDELGARQLRQGHLRRRRCFSPPYAFVDNNTVNRNDIFGLDVYLDTHPVGGTGFNHAFILIEVDCKSWWYDNPAFKTHSLPNGDHYLTLGAGPSFLFWGHLVEGEDRPKDADLSTVNYSRKIIEPSGMSDDDFISRITGAYIRYNNQAWYELFPQSDDDDYNSNSYASGLLDIALDITDGATVVQPPNTPGFEKPVPPSYFP
jgi:RHS repeat-associated protein